MGEQRREKMVKKPKKDTSPPKTGGAPSDRPQPHGAVQCEPLISIATSTKE